MEMSTSQLAAELAAHGQEHLIAFGDDLTDKEQQALAEQICEINFEQINELLSATDATENLATVAQSAFPPPAVRLGDESPEFSRDDARCRGEELLREGKVAAILVAGGQGTRLGFDHPKGMLPVGPVSGASLFQILIEKLLATAMRYGAPVPLYLMSSPATDAGTREYLGANNNFGLANEDLFIFCQGTMPAVDADSGRLLLSEQGRLFAAPDGHGGMLSALDKSGGLANLSSRGIEQLFYFQVDNPLAQVADPEFIGYHALTKSEYSLQAVAKQDPLDRVGNIVSVGGATRIIEYSDLPEDAARRTNEDGSLTLWAGSIAVHVFDVDFLSRMAADADSLPFHIAEKVVPCIDGRGEPVTPERPNALKFERFIFDLLPHAARSLVFEVDAADAFAAVKNAAGAETETIATAQAAMMDQARRWLVAAGAEVAPDVKVEISPLFALDAAELATKLPPGRAVTSDAYFC